MCVCNGHEFSPNTADTNLQSKATRALNELIPIIAIPKYIGIIVKVIVVVIILVIVAVDDAAAGGNVATAATTAIEFIIFADVKVIGACV